MTTPRLVRPAGKRHSEATAKAQPDAEKRQRQEGGEDANNAGHAASGAAKPTGHDEGGPSVEAQSVEASGAASAAASGAGSDAASGAAENRGKQAALMISASPPYRPKLPSAEDIISGRAGNVRTYARKLHDYITWKFSSFLYDDEVVQLRQPLYLSVCPAIEDASVAKPSRSDWKPTSIMEPLDLDHCMWALSESGFYEGAVSIWNIDPFKTEAFGTELHMKDPSWPQFLALLGHWSPGNLTNSHGEEAKQRYFFPGRLLSFVKDTAILENWKRKGRTLDAVPASGGHSVCWSFYAAIDEALEVGDARRLRLLWEVSNQVTIRLRLNPTERQLILDRLAMSDELRVKLAGVGVQSFFLKCASTFLNSQKPERATSLAQSSPG
jgi:hypothetical protein